MPHGYRAFSRRSAFLRHSLFWSIDNLTTNTNVHVQPIVLWQFICGGVELPLRDYQHIVHCTACDTFGEQICDALTGLDTALSGRQVSRSNQLSS
jgi:hypothetical protein